MKHFPGTAFWLEAAGTIVGLSAIAVFFVNDRMQVIPWITIGVAMALPALIQYIHTVEETCKAQSRQIKVLTDQVARLESTWHQR